MNIILFEKLNKNNTLPLKDERAWHLKKILHLGVGDKFSCGIVNGVKGEATITEFGVTSISFDFEALDNNSKELFPITLLISQVRPICMKRILREAVCLGVEKIVITGADLTEKSYAKANFYISGEYKKVLFDGAMQAAQTGISEVVFMDSLDESIKLFGNNYNKIMLDNVLKSEKLSAWVPDNSKNKTVITIGPERGYTDRERNLLLDSGFTPKTIGSRVLRSETASCVALGLSLGALNML
ncbi:MAG: 16S rRNA (uracil(1498)-N(3))-methyltransferase [Spirochaetaceae bacterium]|nr:16S rRNA (uracil(1498)-N(3))-methyltransferase [Spirochaetaceae bacterium]